MTLVLKEELHCRVRTSGRRLERMTDDQPTVFLLESMPYVSEEKYHKLVKASGRKWTPKYREGCLEGWWFWGWFPTPTFGAKPKVVEEVAGEWSAWYDTKHPARDGAVQKERV